MQYQHSCTVSTQLYSIRITNCKPSKAHQFRLSSSDERWPCLPSSSPHWLWGAHTFFTQEPQNLDQKCASSGEHWLIASQVDIRLSRLRQLLYPKGTLTRREHVTNWTPFRLSSSSLRLSQTLTMSSRSPCELTFPYFQANSAVNAGYGGNLDLTGNPACDAGLMDSHLGPCAVTNVNCTSTFD